MGRRTSLEFSNIKYCSECGSLLKDYNALGYKKCSQDHCQKKYYDNPKVGVSVIYIKDGKIFLGKRSGSYKSGQWCIPCGYLENEGIEDGAAREFKEETSLSATKLNLYDVITNKYHDTQNILSVYYKAVKVSGSLKANDDLSEVAFFDLKDVPELAFTLDKMIIERLSRKECMYE